MVKPWLTLQQSSCMMRAMLGMAEPRAWMAQQRVWRSLDFLGISEAFMDEPLHSCVTDPWIFMCDNKTLYV